jgi:hypothetical protein
MTENSSVSKRQINLEAERVFGGRIDVVCSRGHFSYIYSRLNLYIPFNPFNFTARCFAKQAKDRQPVSPFDRLDKPILVVNNSNNNRLYKKKIDLRGLAG